MDDRLLIRPDLEPRSGIQVNRRGVMVHLLFPFAARLPRVRPGSVGGRGGVADRAAVEMIQNGRDFGKRLATIIFVTIAHLPSFAAAQTSLLTESVNVLDANSAVVATLSVPRSGIQSSEVAVLINDNDPQSVEIANYYQQARNLPSRNMIHLRFEQDKIYPGLPANNGIDPAEFAVLKQQVDAQAGPEVQAFVISWSRPFRIARFNYYPTNYSITSAFAFGIDTQYLTSRSCDSTPLSPYYDSRSTMPYTDFGIRPAMMLAGESATSVKATIDKGLKADRSLPKGNGWFVRTADNTRSMPRYPDFQATVQNWNRPEALRMTYYDRSRPGGPSEVKNTKDILFYETGLANISSLNTNTYVPGALADSLTSGGGDLFGSNQTSALRWLEAGVSASYGTVTEPCAYADKFPAASVLVKNYFLGNTALEAYTKSVRQPSQGVFIGDPLARPFGTQATLVNEVLNIKTSILEPGVDYNLYSAPSPTGPFSLISTISVPDYRFATITLTGMRAPFYKLDRGGESAPRPDRRN